MRRLLVYLCVYNNDWGRADFIRRALVVVIQKAMDFRVVVISNKNLPRSKAFQARRYESCIVFMFRLFDVSFWWGDSYQDLEVNNELV